VVKLPPAGPGIFPTYDFPLQARCQEVAARAGVPTAIPVRVEEDTSWMGAPFLVMPAVAGHIIGEMPVADRWLSKADPERNTTVHHRYLDTVAAINTIDWEGAGLADVVPVLDNRGEVERWRAYLDWYADGVALVPALVEALEWCAAHRPATEPAPSLQWGDVRLGNVVFDETPAPVAVLDWEMATIGPAEHDLAWALALEGIQLELFQRGVPGFLDHDAAVERYEGALGRTVHALDWYEILALVRSTAIMTRVAYLQERAGTPAVFPIADNPILAILARRIAESRQDW